MFRGKCEIEQNVFPVSFTHPSVGFGAIHSRVSNVNLVLWGWAPDIFPVCPDVDSLS
jgi:hypothetical protein